MMAGGTRKRVSATGIEGKFEEAEEYFGPRSRPKFVWDEIVKRRSARPPEVSLDVLTERNVLRVGIETRCPHCTFTNWHSIAAGDYQLECERCLKTYRFPQSSVSSRTWSYRVVGPFSVPDYAKGAYGTVLALRAVKSLLVPSCQMTYMPGVQMEISGTKGEADYVAWLSREPTLETSFRPSLIVGEAKSLGDGDLVKPKDVAKLKRIVAHLPGATVAVSVLREEFTESEKLLLAGLVRWGRRGGGSRPRNHVLLLTGVEMFDGRGFLSSLWNDKGGRHKEFAAHHHTSGLYEIAESSVAIHLGLPSYNEERRAAWEARGRRQAARRAETSSQLTV